MCRSHGRPAFMLFLAVLFLMSCSANPPRREMLVCQAPEAALGEEFLPVELTMSEAESLCVSGSEASALGDWAQAHEHYSEALSILSTLDLTGENSESLSARFDALLMTLSVEYPKVLSHLEELPEESSLALLLMRLGELRSDVPTEAVRDSALVSEAQSDGAVYDVPIHWNSEVEKCIQLFRTKNRSGFSTWLRRSGRYKDMMQNILREHGLPEDLVYVPLIESGFNPDAYSWAHASGPWQFISSTAKLYGLKNDWWLDERRDPEKSTRAAARYLRDLYEEFQSWPLALAGYNCGEKRVRRAIGSAGTRNFWELDLPRQTENYVPLYMAATIIAKSPEKYGFSKFCDEPLEYDIVKIDECTDLRVAARCSDSSFEQIKTLNPELRRWCTPPNSDTYLLKIPKGRRNTFLTKYAQVPASEKVSWERHHIRKGETLSGIARRYGTSVRAIKEANSMRSSNRIYAGKYLLIPVASSGGSVSSISPPASSGGQAGGKLIYTVKRGDALSRIAASFGVSLSQLRRWNSLRSGQYIYPGDKLTVYLSDNLSGSSSSVDDYSELIYTVKRGDTLWDIANDFGVSLSDLVRENQLTNPSRLKPGSKLKIKMSKKL